MADSKFKLLKVTKLEDLKEGIIKELPESDLCIQGNDFIAQFEFEDEEDSKTKFEIKPGIFTIAKSSVGLVLQKLPIKSHDLLESATNTSLIKNEANVFYKKIDVYKKFNRDPRRSILLYSIPGLGKTATLTQLSHELIEEDKGTVVVFWDTSDIGPSAVSKFLSTGSFFNKDCTRMLFLMEDIGGGNVEDYHGPKTADSGLLELLDGASVSFSLPTFIVATTNTPENLLKSLADRPGRFDQMFELMPPNAEERVKLVKHIAKRELTEEETLAIESKSADGLSIAHLSEIVIRAELHDKTFEQVIDEMKNHKKKIEAAFQKAKKSMGLN